MPLTRPDQRSGPGGWPRRANPQEELWHPDPRIRRAAARDLAASGADSSLLGRRLESEDVPAVREALFMGLVRCGDPPALECLVRLLRSGDPAVRSGAVEALQQLPEGFAEHRPALLADPDPQVRLRGVEVMRDLRHPEVPRWLEELVRTEAALNVWAAAVDCLGEVGNKGDIPLLQAQGERFPDEPYAAFAVREAIRRLGGSP